MRRTLPSIIMGALLFLIVACFCPPGQCEAATAKPISTLNTTINCDYYSGTESWHYVTLKKWQCVGVVMYPHLNTGYLSMYVVDVNNGTVNQAEYNSDGSFAWIDFYALYDGYYFIKVVGSSNASGNYDLGVYDNWFNAGVYDSSRNFYSTTWSAKYISNGSHTLDSRGTDVYRLVATRDTPLNIQVQPSLDSGYINIQLCDAGGNECKRTDYIGNGKTGQIYFTPALTGTYYLKVTAGNSAQGSYNLLASGCQPDIDSDNDGLKDAAEYYNGLDIHKTDTDGDGTDDMQEFLSGRSPWFDLELAADTLSGKTTPLPRFDKSFLADYSGGDHLYSMDLYQGQAVSIRFIPYINSGSLNITLYGPNNNSIDYKSYVSGWNKAFINYKANATGTYTIKINSNNQPLGTYCLAVFNAWSNDGVTDRDREYYSNFYTAAYLSDGNHVLSSDGDYYRFTGKKNTTVSFTVTPQLNYGSINLYLCDINGNTLKSCSYLSSGQKGTISQNIALDGTYYLVVTKNSASGNYDLDVTGVDLYPVVKSSSPVGGADGVAIDSDIHIVFSQNIYRGTGQITLTGSNNETVPVNVVINGNTLFLMHDDLMPDTTYTAVIEAAAIQNSNGQPMNNDYSFSFTTQSGTQQLPPKTTSNRFKTWTVVFSDAVNTDTVTQDNFYVTEGQTKLDCRPIPGQNANEVMILPPNAGYESGHTYTIYIRSPQSQSGKALKSGVCMRFTVN